MPELIAIMPEVDGDLLLVPRGMRPVLMPTSWPRRVYVVGWTPQKEYGATAFDAYSLDRALQIPLVLGVNGIKHTENWLSGFGAPVSEARRREDGSFIYREQLDSLSALQASGS